MRTRKLRPKLALYPCVRAEKEKGKGKGKGKISKTVVNFLTITSPFTKSCTANATAQM
jgi:hypothetical protein